MENNIFWKFTLNTQGFTELTQRPSLYMESSGSFNLPKAPGILDMKQQE